jgi:type IV pilus assembly protein PilX
MTTQRGITLVTTLIMMIGIMLIGASAANLALQGERGARGDRDRQIALQAAEAGLLDAETDIEESASGLRAEVFNKSLTGAFSIDCQNGQSSNDAYLGLCLAGAGASAATAVSPWLRLDAKGNSSQIAWVPYGHFSGRTMQTGVGPLPANAPRYLIERMPYNQPGASAESEGQTPIYRVTALGFGMRQSTQVMLQSLYRKAGGE